MTETPRLTHLDADGRAQMVDVTAKVWTRRVAVARGRVACAVDPMSVLDSTGLGPGPLETARLAGVGAAKRAWDYIPLCHPIQLIDVDVTIEADADGFAVEATTEVIAPTGVEMEALMAVGVAGLSLVQSLSSEGVGAAVTEVALWRKHGGRSGTWTRPVSR